MCELKLTVVSKRATSDSKSSGLQSLDVNWYLIKQ